MNSISVLRIITICLTVVGILTHCVCAVLFGRNRKLRREYPFFLSYLIFQVLSQAILGVFYYRVYFAHTGSRSAYYYNYWIEGAIVDIFALAVFKEIFLAAFKPFAGLRDMAQIVFRWAIAALVLISVAVMFSSSLPGFQRLTLLVLNLERVICIMQCALLVFLFMGSSYLGLSWRSHVFGLSLGFGVLATSNLFFFMVVSILGYDDSHTILFKLIPPVSFVLAPSIWAFYLAQTEPARDVVNVPVTSPLMRWNEAALALGHSAGRVAFIENPEPFMPEVKLAKAFQEKRSGSEPERAVYTRSP
jgi:hypothetical protein